MRVPLSWLAEYVTLPPGVTPEGVQESLVSIGLEEEGVHSLEVSGPIVVGEVLEFVEEPQSNGKTIRWCQVKVAKADTPNSPAIRGIVCGAANFEVGDLVVVSLPGAILPGPFPISARQTYGHTSDGMIASAKELGLGEDHSGILRLATLGIDAPVGTDAIELLGLDDVAVEVNVTPDRGYALSMRGIAREYHHATGAKFTDPAAQLTPGVGKGFSITLEDATPIRGVEGCQVFVTRAVDAVNPQAPTPAFMVARLALAGMRSISLPVDITNYVMLEMGQPIHAYDLDALTGGITVRRAMPGEQLVTLDGLTRQLDPEDLLITDDSGPIGLAGVMGGASTEISESTTRVLVEAAWFDPVSIARTQRRHKLPSEASKRFARGVDPLVAEAAAERVVDLLERFAGGSRSELGSRVIHQDAGVMPGITLAHNAVVSLAGIDVTPQQTEKILLDIGATVVKNKDSFVVTPPSWRPDVVDAPGLVEEVARIVGYDSVPSELPIAPAGRGLTPRQAAKRRVSHSVAAWGLTEVLSYPFVSDQDNVTFGDTGAPGVEVHNALDSLVNRMRTSLIPGLLGVAHRNVSRGFTSLALGEMGLVFVPGKTLGTANIPQGAAKPDDATLAELYDSTPHQPWCVAGLFLGPAVEKSPGVRERPSDVQDAADAVAVVCEALNASYEIRQDTHPAFHPGRFARIVVAGVDVGRVGELLPSLTRERDLPGRVSVFELDADAVLDAVGLEPHDAQALSVFPAATQDVSLVVDATLPAAELRQTLVEGMGELLESLRVVDDYRGDGVTEGQKSLTFALRFRAADRTLTQAEATGAKEAGVALAASRHSATLRA
jgi:phenylalanyl-tRNA synthetase beta chain